MWRSPPTPLCFHLRSQGARTTRAPVPPNPRPETAKQGRPTRAGCAWFRPVGGCSGAQRTAN
eukprot:1241398-Alexandrium_andersonii.AAC.1